MIVANQPIALPPGERGHSDDAGRPPLSALVESDIRSRALAVGWREDALGRLACPGCVQHDPTFRISYPVVPGWPGSVPPVMALPAEPWPETATAADASWTGSQPWPKLAMTTDEPEPRLARFRRREAGRHRLAV
jgi:hypothetical protein